VDVFGVVSIESLSFGKQRYARMIRNFDESISSILLSENIYAAVVSDPYFHVGVRYKGQLMHTHR
jgi:hypothetical protein